MILGTAAYMSPEQARGKPLDKRTDIWAFGCVLYEMLTGRRAFAGDEVSDVLASVLAREPDLAALPATAPPSIRRLLRRCLQKDRNERLRDIGDARIEIRDALANADPEATVVSVPGADRRGRERLAWIRRAGCADACLGRCVDTCRRPGAAASEMRVDITTPPTTVPMSLAISPDGRTIAFVADFRRPIAVVAAFAGIRCGASSDRDRRCGISVLVAGQPVRRFLCGWQAQADRRRRRIGADTGRTLREAQGGAWNRDGVILFASLGTPIFRVSGHGWRTSRRCRDWPSKGVTSRHSSCPMAVTSSTTCEASPEVRGVYVGQLDEALEPRRLLDADTGAVYASSGHLLFVRQGTLFAQGFDPVRLELTGNPFPVAEQVASTRGCQGIRIRRRLHRLSDEFGRRSAAVRLV